MLELTSAVAFIPDVFYTQLPHMKGLCLYLAVLLLPPGPINPLICVTLLALSRAKLPLGPVLSISGDGQGLEVPAVCVLQTDLQASGRQEVPQGICLSWRLLVTDGSVSGDGESGLDSVRHGSSISSLPCHFPNLSSVSLLPTPLMTSLCPNLTQLILSPNFSFFFACCVSFLWLP